MGPGAVGNAKLVDQLVLRLVVRPKFRRIHEKGARHVRTHWETVSPGTYRYQPGKNTQASATKRVSVPPSAIQLASRYPPSPPSSDPPRIHQARNKLTGASVFFKPSRSPHHRHKRDPSSIAHVPPAQKPVMPSAAQTLRTTPAMVKFSPLACNCVFKISVGFITAMPMAPDVPAASRRCQKGTAAELPLLPPLPADEDERPMLAIESRIGSYSISVKLE